MPASHETLPDAADEELPQREYGLSADAYPFHSRRSLYFIDRLPPPKGIDGLTHFVTSERLDRLASIKEVDEDFVPDRETPVWPVSKAAMRYGPPSARIQQLAIPKPLSPNYEFHRNCYMAVAEPAKRATASERTRRLAQSNPHKIWPSTDGYLDPGFTYPARAISPAALTTACSPQVIQLAEYRPLDDECQPERPLPIPVSQGALQTTATPRLSELSRPARGAAQKMDPGEVEREEEAVYRVSVPALTCVASRRTIELAAPIRIKGVRISVT